MSSVLLSCSLLFVITLRNQLSQLVYGGSPFLVSRVHCLDILRAVLSFFRISIPDMQAITLHAIGDAQERAGQFSAVPLRHPTTQEVYSSSCATCARVQRKN